MQDLVLDAWAIMVWLKGQEPAASRVRMLLEAAERRELKLSTNIVNLGEVFYLSVKAKGTRYGNRVLHGLRPRVTIVSASDELVMLAATLKAHHPISYADGFAAATAIAGGIPLVTGDTELKALAAAEKALRLEWIGS